MSPPDPILPKQNLRLEKLTPAKLKKLPIAIPPKLHDTFLAEGRIVLDQSGSGFLLFSREMLEMVILSERATM